MIAFLPGVLALCLAAGPEPVEKLQALLSDPDRGVRYAAIGALAAAGTGWERIAALLEDPEWCVRAEAARALGEGGEKAVSPLLRVLEHGSPRARAGAIEALGRIGRPEAARGLDDPDFEVRVAAARALRHAPEEILRHSVPRLLELLEPELEEPYDLEYHLSFHAAHALARLEEHHAQVRPILEICLRDAYPWANRFARKELDRWNPTPPEEPAPLAPDDLLAEDPYKRRKARLLLKGLGERAAEHVPFLLESVRKQSGDALAHAAAALQAIGVDPRPLLLERLPEEEALRALVVVGATSGSERIRLALASPQASVRAQAALALGSLGLAAPAADDPDPLVRAAAAWSRRRAGEDVSWADRDPEGLVREMAAPQPLPEPPPAFLHAPGWRSRRDAAARGLGTPEELAAALADPVVLVGEAAAATLGRGGAAAASAVAAAIEGGNEATWHHAASIFEALGAGGAPAAETLARLLGHANLNIRGSAIRCLAAIGPGASPAAGALVEALGDPYLCVVNHAAIALGRIGLGPELVAALSHPRARVRAYAAFAAGWALAEARCVEQVAYERRLPVLDCGPGPTVYQELLSSDPRIAVPFAARLEYAKLNAWESERVVELLLPEGFRLGSPGDFDELRSILGSSELPAAVGYLARAYQCDPPKSNIFGHLHRISRADNLPALLAFERSERPEALDGIEMLRQPLGRTETHLGLYLRFFGLPPPSAPGPGLDPSLKAWLESQARGRPYASFDRRALWWLLESEPAEGDGALLMRCAEAARTDFEAGVFLRSLGFLGDAETERFLRAEALGNGWDALAALARRGLPDALARLAEQAGEAGEVEEARHVRGEAEEALARLLWARPGFAARWLRERLVDPDQGPALCRVLAFAIEELLVESGIRWDERVFLGIEEAALKARLPAAHLARIAVDVPLCGTKRLAAAILERLEAEDPGAWTVEEFWADSSDVHPFLFAADPERLTRLLRRAAAVAPEKVRGAVLDELARIGDSGAASLLLAAGGAESDHLGRVRTPEMGEFLKARVLEGDCSGFLEWSGLPRRLPLAPEGGEVDLARVVRGEALELFLELLPRLESEWNIAGVGRVQDPRIRPALERAAAARAFSYPRLLGQLVLAGDRAARAELWSALRAGRYRWVVDCLDRATHTLGDDPATLAHWIEDLESNCCRIGGCLDQIFEYGLGVKTYLNGIHEHGVGEPPSRRVRTELSFYGARFVWSPLLDRLVPVPE